MSSSATRSRRPALDARLQRLAERVGSVDPRPYLAELLDATFDAGYGDNALVPGGLPLELSFSEGTPDALRLDLAPAPGRAPGRRIEVATAAVRALVAGELGPDVLRELDERLAAWSAAAGPPRGAFGGFFGACFDAAGPAAAKVYFEVTGALPDDFRGAAAHAGSAIAGATPHLVSLAARRGGLDRRLYLRCAHGLRLLDLEALLEGYGLGARVPATVVAVRELAGGAFALPPNSALVAVPPLGAGGDLKIELLVGHLRPGEPYPTARIVGSLASRPPAQIALQGWLRAVGPARVTVVSVRVSHDAGPRLNVYVSPHVRGWP